jgi:hypothetical protein
MLPVLAWRFYFVDVCPTLSDRVRLKQRLAQLRYVQNLLFVPYSTTIRKQGATFDSHISLYLMFWNAKHNFPVKHRQRTANTDRKIVVHTRQ